MIVCVIRWICSIVECCFRKPNSQDAIKQLVTVVCAVICTDQSDDK